MSAVLDYMRLCRLCLVKDKVHVPIFGAESDVRQIFLKITACLPVKVSQEDNLPKNICNSCLLKVDLLYQFWNTTVNAEKQLIQWLAEIGVDVNIKNTSPPNITPQSHAHPHSMPEAIILKEERPDPEIKSMEQSQNFHMDTQYSGYEMPYQPQVNMTVGAPTDFTQPTDAPAEEDVKVPQQKAQPTKPTPAKRRGRPPKQKTPPAVQLPPPEVPPAATSTATGSKRRSSAAAAAAAFAAAAANASSDESDVDDRFGGDDSDDEDMDVRIAKEEADSEDEEYVDNPESLEPTAFVGVPSTSACDSEQPGPSGLGGAITTGKTSSALPAAAANESGSQFMSKDLEFIWLLHETNHCTEIRGPNNKWIKVFKCPSCPQTFRERNKFLRHGMKHVKTRNFVCPVCKKAYKNKYILTKHMKIHSGIAYKFTCEICNKRYYSKNLYEKHIRKYPPSRVLICPKCNNRYHKQSDYSFHMMREHRGSYSCFSCGSVFDTTESLRQHVQTHNGQTSEFQCEFCGKPFSSNLTLDSHLKNLHLGLRCVFCDICGKKLSSKCSLKEHMLLHKGEKPLTCERCGKTFAKRSTLRVHERTHTGERPHVCPHCDKRFTQRKSLVIHVRSHTGERPYPCDLCPDKFSSRTGLNLHRKSRHKIVDQ